MKKDNKTVIAVVMKSTRGNEYHDVETIGNFGLDHIDVQQMFQKGDTVGETTFYGESVEGTLSKPYVLTKRKGDEAVYTNTPVFNTWQSGKNKIEAGEVIGAYQIKKNGELLTQIPIVSAKEVTHSDPAPMISHDLVRTSSTWWYWLVAGIMLFAYGLYSWMKKRSQRKQVMTLSNEKYTA
ncbi:hypothetical protein HQN89_19725 [Paenibacillus frigoriresistens]|uniref:hypothetical protein n=1 Tax=Paenibacillus alginolyticus TaxID=59839 RepID=UPI00156359DE|nr:hypothetical protein [Paenibacillus frigoriresistens]NRF93204.1 hypothetical protein [Paenibacillus frigoriresistens]